jgi:two-component system response regulator YesN
VYRLILIDDEEIVRKGIRYFLDWHAIGFDIVADFEDGKEALEYLQTHSVDVVLTDIGMVEVDGLAVAKWVHQNLPRTKVVLISGYKDFDYAKKAIEYNVEHYLLKPTKYDEVLDVFNRLKAWFDEQSSLATSLKQDKSRLEELTPLLHEQFTIDLTMGVFRREEELLQRNDLIRFAQDLPHTACALLELNIAPNCDGGTPPSSVMLPSIVQIFRTDFPSVRYYPIFQHEQQLKMLAISPLPADEQPFRDVLQLQTEQLIGNIGRLFGIELTICATTYFPNLIALSQYSKPLQLVYNIQHDKSRLDSIEYDKLLQKYKVFFSHITEGNLAETQNLFDRFMEEFSELPITYVHRLVMDLFALITQEIVERGIVEKDLYKKRYDYHQVVELKTLSEISEWSKQYLSILMQLLVVREETNAANSVERAKRFISEQYRSDLTLEEVANHVFLHPVYFSRMFKQATGMNYIDFLTRIRIQEAIRLLEAGEHKIYEITAMVGYKNREYFTRLFKQTTGLSPKDYLYHYRMKDNAYDTES